VLPKAPGIVPPVPAAPAVAINPPAPLAEAPKIPAAPVLSKAPGVALQVPASPSGAAPKQHAPAEAAKPAPPVVVSPPKNQTAKISLPATKSVPQATMNLKKPVAPSTPAVADKKASAIEPAESNVAAGKGSDPDLILGIAATIVALASLGIQVWTLIG